MTTFQITYLAGAVVFLAALWVYARRKDDDA
jgi:hypothetical protein